MVKNHLGVFHGRCKPIRNYFFTKKDFNTILLQSSKVFRFSFIFGFIFSFISYIYSSFAKNFYLSNLFLFDYFAGFSRFLVFQFYFMLSYVFKDLFFDFFSFFFFCFENFIRYFKNVYISFFQRGGVLCLMLSP